MATTDHPPRPPTAPGSPTSTASPTSTKGLLPWAHLDARLARGDGLLARHLGPGRRAAGPPARRPVARRRPVRRRQPGDALGPRPGREPAASASTSTTAGTSSILEGMAEVLEHGVERPVAESLAAMARGEVPAVRHDRRVVHRSRSDRHPSAAGVRLDIVPEGCDPLLVRVKEPGSNRDRSRVADIDRMRQIPAV